MGKKSIITMEFSGKEEDYPEQIMMLDTEDSVKDNTEQAITKLPSSFSQPSTNEIKRKTIHLGPRKQGKTLILDIDNTLIYSTRLETDSSKTVDSSEQFIIKIRPYTKVLLEALSPLYEIVLFTAGIEEYAKQVNACLDPKGLYITKVLGRSSCIPVDETHYVKDLRIFGDRELKDMVIVDDQAISYSSQTDNGIPVTPYFGESEDEELKFLIKYLEGLALADDIALANSKEIKQYYVSEERKSASHC